MSDEQKTERIPRFGVFRNWLSLAGLVLAMGSLFCFVLLFFLDTMAHFSNPYVGILTYIVSPSFLFLGVFLAVAGVVWRRWRHKKHESLVPVFQIDLGRARDRRYLGFFLGGSAVFLLVSAVLSYHTYHFTESTQFCGQACHTVMKPEMVTYHNGAHARVACVECHIGPGATWFVKSKLSGTYQVYATAFEKYPRPVPTPIKNLRPAQETCEQCHWPQKFTGNLDRNYQYFLGDETNTPYTVRMLMHVGGGDPSHGPTGGIHWHMNVANKIEYIAADDARQKIPWVRMTDSQGVVTEFRSPRFTNEINQAAIRTMDCMDCHNRPAHTYETPNDAVNLALALGTLDRSLSYIKTNAVFALTQAYTDEKQALQGIATFLASQYPGHPSTRQAIATVQQIYTNNFFPEMKADWQAYPNNIGHKDWPGCFRCHDGKHTSTDGKRTIEASDCNTCHTILAQGFGAELDLLTPNGQPFKHPGGDEVGNACNDCHTGGL